MKQNKEIKVFFGCSMRGGHTATSQEELTKLSDTIEELGCKLVSKHQTQVGIVQKEDKLATFQIHDRDYRWETKSDIGIFEISNPSLGVGGEISDMIYQRKPVLCLFKKGLDKSISAYTRGKQGSQFVNTPFECHAYKTMKDAKQKIILFIEDNL